MNQQHHVTRGTCEDRGKNTWRCQYRVDGQPVPSITVRATGKKEARKLIEAEKLRRLQLAASPQQRMLTIAQVLELWLDAHLPSVPAPRSRGEYTYVVRHYLIPVLGSKPASGEGCLSTSDVIAWRKYELETKGYAPNSVAQHLLVLRMALNWAARHQPEPLVPVNVASSVRFPSIPDSKRVIFTVEESLRLLDMTKPPIRCLLALGMLGLRRGEALGVERKGLDFERKRIQVAQQVLRINGTGLVHTLPKMARERSVPMPDWIVPILRDQIEWSMKMNNQTDLLLVSVWGNRPMEPRQVSTYMKKACQLAGIEQGERTFHSLRHGYGSLMRRAGIADVDIAHSMGHKNTKMLERLYGNHPDEDRDQRMASAYDHILGTAKVPDTHEKEA
ncbi:MAG: site-specific integrase [Patescibacteria group bacterium]|nr:site-specific integrase [Patescibacteria group bacterium]